MDKEFFNYITSSEGKAKLKERNEKLKKFCAENNITRVQNEFYFDLFNVHFMVSLNTIKVSNAKSLKEKMVLLSDPEVDRTEIIHIRGNKDTIMQIYTDLKNGIELDYNGNRVEQKPIPKPKPQPQPTTPTQTTLNINRTAPTRQSARQQAIDSLFKRR